ncbi:MAG: T9SS type A sorting domain-containing protein [Hymenobacter sp.]|nr:MAG: T9SS type A sorting domain-containing protein [Hymenobacter sp.]
MFKHYLLGLLLAIGFRPALATKYYVAPAGNDASSGTITAPFLTIQRAQTAVVAGDTVYIRGGTYLMQNAQIAAFTSPYAYITLLNKSGSAGRRINYWAYPGERPVFNYAGVDPNVSSPNAPFAAPYRLSAFEVTGAYIHLRGLEVVGLRVPLVANNINTLSICFSQSGAGGNNIYEQLSMHDGQAIGFYLTRGPNNLILNCDAYRNNDNVNTANTTGTAGGGNVDGFGNHPNNANYTGNVFRGCRAWQNSDDGYDCISAFAATTFENCWAFYNGYTQNFVGRGDGNGFKAGGYGTATSFPAVIPNNTVQFCVSVRNRSNGFYSNHHQAGSYWYDNTAYQNAVNYNMVNRKDRTTSGYLVDVPGYGHVLRNNVSLRGRSAANPDTISLSSSASTYDHNTFGKVAIAVAASDFISLDTTLLRAPRQVDGSLPVVPLLRLAPGSGLIDAGTSAGFPAGYAYSGPAPDLGAYEAAALTVWTGAASTDWFAAGNWTAGVPTAALDALVPVVSTGRYPLIGAGTAAAQSLTLDLGATLSQSGGTLNLTGNLTHHGTYVAVAPNGLVATTGSAAQLLGGNSPLAFANLSIGAAGAALRAPASFRRVLTLAGNLSTDNQVLTLLSSVSGGGPTDGLVVNSGGVVRGTATVQRAIDPSLNSGLGYRHYSAPVSTAPVTGLATSNFGPVVNPAYNTAAAPASTVPFPTVFGYDDSRLGLSNSLNSFDKGFVSPAALSDALAVGRGYTVNIAASEVVDFQGSLNNGDLPVALTSARASYPDGGWQLLGNPYPAPLDYSLVDPADRPGLEDAIYVYSSTGPYVGQYRSYVNRVGNPVLPLGQAFFARVAAGQSTAAITFRNGQRLSAPTSTTMQRPTAETRPLVQLTLQGTGSPLADEATVYFEQGATAGFDSAYDAEKLPNPNGLNLAASQGSRQFSINGQPVLGTAQRVLPLAVGVPAAGSYTLMASQLLNLAGVPVYLRDLQAGAVIDLAQQPSYQFAVANAAGLNTTRFELIFLPQQPLAAAPAALAQQVAVYPNPAKNQVAIELPQGLSRQPVAAVLLDALGRVVRQRVLPVGLAAHLLPLAGVAPGIYSLRLTTELGPVVRKLVIE